MSLPLWMISRAEEALREVLKLDAPADSILSRYFRANPKLGVRARGTIAEAVYDVLRCKRFYVEYAQSGQTNLRKTALLGLSATAGIDALSGIAADEREWLENISAVDVSLLPPSMRSGFPQWLFEKLCGQYGEEETLKLAEALNQPAPLDVRVNVLKATREQVCKIFDEEKRVYEKTEFSPLGLRLQQKSDLQQLKVFKDGLIEVQDEGSQILSQIVGAKRSEMVVDFCAGAGGKSLALGAIMRNTGRLYAFDVSEKRLSKLKPRLARSGLSNIHPVRISGESDAKIKRYSAKSDRVLVDAPCSGLGTLRRNPDIKWRQTSDGIAELCEKQYAILKSAARLPKPGGRLVYATCSILREENEDIVQKFLAEHNDYQLLPAGKILEKQKIGLQMQDVLKLLPHIHGTDGFFAAVFQKK